MNILNKPIARKKPWYVFLSFLSFAILLLLIGGIKSAKGVPYGQPDVNNLYPYVGIVVFYNADKIPFSSCSGSLISPKLFLTAGHCTSPDSTSPQPIAPVYAQVWFDIGPLTFDPEYEFGTSCDTSLATGFPCKGGRTGIPIPNPSWPGTFPNTHDVGAVVLDEAYQLSTYGQVAPIGYLDSLLTKRGLQNKRFIIVGYGLQQIKPFLSDLIQRHFGDVSLINLKSVNNGGYNIQYTSNPSVGTGSGGNCFGDSGGPLLSVDSTGKTYIVAVNSFVINSLCKGTGFSFRVDTAESQQFINSIPVN